MIITNLVLQIIIAVGGIGAAAVYFLKKRTEKRDAAVMVVQQIMDVRIKIVEMQKCLFDTGVSELSFYEMRPIVIRNLWDEYKHILIGKIDWLSYQEIENFYSCAQAIERERNIGQNILFTYFNMQGVHYNQSKMRLIEAFINSNSGDAEQFSNEKFATCSDALEKIFNMPGMFTSGFPIQIATTIRKLLSEYEKIDVIGCKGFHEIQKIAKIK